MSQVDLARAIDVTALTVWRWETGRVEPEPGTIALIILICRKAIERRKRAGLAPAEVA